ncbi:uncharacterized protein KY384_008535 [Bacidia gigantensis]|uniref:uncharacterized protein n=1 Tax=Bacidia gigantensis TaxID=2732470 RepID=UPI001D04C07C|nr:uncharacterized protein KY384_008535 [Bacidia gigantensis]KAG8527106.1 hypothetical protein KY384_008535 [Bacidia gigantensis]
MSAVQDEAYDGPEQSEGEEETQERASGLDDESGVLGHLEPGYGDGDAVIEEEQKVKLDVKGKTTNGHNARPYCLQEEGISSPPSSRDGPERPSSAEGSSSIPDDTASMQGSLASTPNRGARNAAPSQSPTPSLQPFERRFHSRLSSYTGTPRATSPAFLTSHSRNSSLAFTLREGKDTEVEVPWEVVRWTKLKKMTGQCFSEVGKRKFGRPTCIAISALIVLGTSRGMTLLFDYNQDLRSIIGPGTKALESGAVTAVGISADHSIVASGHASGSIFTWEVAKPSKPFLHIAPASRSRKPLIDGHSPDAAVLHLGFLGIRHTALCSADDKGMAFSHLATRGMSMVARSVKTTRILGRYPESTTNPATTRKPSSVLSFSPLPLGNVEHPTDTMGLVAMLTPYLLVVVSTMPIAQTQYKTPRPREVASHSAMTGALAWFPSVKLKTSNSDRTTSSRAKLAYCWSDVLTVLDVVDIEPSETAGKSEPPSLRFKPRSRWKAQEAIVGVQWLGRSVLAILTITQQLVILEDYSMTVTDSSDLIQKHVYHVDLFSQQLNQLVDQLEDEENSSMHGVVADAFYMSFRAYKGRLFLLGHNELSFGTLSNWADRLAALVEEGSYILAIELATGYFTGAADKVTVGLPEDDGSRQDIVREKLLEMILASLKYAFAQNTQHSQAEQRQHLDELARACINACISTQNLDFLFDQVYPWFQENDVESLFLEGLESGIDAGNIVVLPPEVVKGLVSHYTSRGLSTRLEEMLCLLDPRTMDLDQITSLCKVNYLYDALLYVWNQAIGDYTTILAELLCLSLPQQNELDGLKEEAVATKVFPYLSYILTGRVYPTGKDMDQGHAQLAKADLYNFLFSGKGPDGSLRGDSGSQSSKSNPRMNFPNLRKILDLDTSSFLSMLNEAFEDSFLNGPQERLANETPGGLTEAQRFGLSVNRQWIVSILLEVMTPPTYTVDDTIYLYMFIARNLPKFPQFILLPGHLLHKVLIGLCKYPSDDVLDDSQLSVEYLLSLYHPPDIGSLISLLHEARFYRVLKNIFKSERQYAQLLQTCFDDREHPDAVFECVADFLNPGASLTENQILQFRDVIKQHAEEMVNSDLTKTASIIDQFAPDLHRAMLSTIEHDESRQFHYLEMILEPTIDVDNNERSSSLTRPFIEQYVLLMCQYNPKHVSDYVDQLKTSDLRLQEVLPALEEHGVIDAAVVLMAREGKIREGMNRLTQHLHTLEAALLGVLDAGEQNRKKSSGIIESVHKFTQVGIWMCRGQTQVAAQTKPVTLRKSSSKALADDLSADESLWLDLLDAVVTVVKNATAILERLGRNEDPVEEAVSDSDWSKSIIALRAIVQELFTALLNTKAVPRKDGTRQTDISFLRILRAFLGRASQSSPTLSNLRGVLSAIFSAYSYEEELLSLSNRLLDKDLSVQVTEADTLRRRGWRPLGQVCEGCNKRVWGPGAGYEIWDAWRQGNEERERVKSIGLSDNASSGEAKGKEGKGKGVPRQDGRKAILEEGANDEQESQIEAGEGPVVIFACRHMFHRSCLAQMQAGRNEAHQRADKEDDPTHGYVNYIDQSSAQGGGLIGVNNGVVTIKSDSTKAGAGRGRDSVRVTSKKQYTHGLVILDLEHMPGSACGIWPAFWMTGPNWPNQGEIDIIEGVNYQSQNAFTMHTGGGCTMINKDCYGSQGCSVQTGGASTYGDGFNQGKGGVYAMEWTSGAINIWFFGRGSNLGNVLSDSPDPSQWGGAMASFQGGSSCNINDHFKDNNLVFDTTFCGDWAGNVWSQDATCSSKAATCIDFVRDNPSAFTEAYWTINSLKVFSNNGQKADTPAPAPAPTPDPTPAAAPVASSAPAPIASPQPQPSQPSTPAPSQTPSSGPQNVQSGADGNWGESPAEKTKHYAVSSSNGGDWGLNEIEKERRDLAEREAHRGLKDLPSLPASEPSSSGVAVSRVRRHLHGHKVGMGVKGHS